eukprot:5266197-Lingulodinium_polyedra.AAC.1
MAGPRRRGRRRGRPEEPRGWPPSGGGAGYAQTPLTASGHQPCRRSTSTHPRRSPRSCGPIR